MHFVTMGPPVFAEGRRMGKARKRQRGEQRHCPRQNFPGLTAGVLSNYHGKMVIQGNEARVQTGLRLERRTLKVLKALAEYLDLSLGDLVEGMALHAFEGKLPFSPKTLAVIAKLKDAYGLALDARDSHRLRESAPDD